MEEITDKKGFDLKKKLPWLAITVAVIVLIIILVSVFGGGPKKAIKNLAKGITKQDTNKIVNSIDFAGMRAWYQSNYNVNDFSKDDYKEFVNDYKDVEKNYSKQVKEGLKPIIEKVFGKIKDNYKSVSVKVEKVNSTQKLGKSLYAVDAKVSLIAKPKDKNLSNIDVSASFVFIIYKNKVIGVDLTNYMKIVEQLQKIF